MALLTILLHVQTSLVATQKNFCAQVLYNPTLNFIFRSFCMNVLQMQTREEWTQLLQNVKRIYPTIPTDAELYRQLRTSYSAMQPKFYPYRLYKSLKKQQCMLGDQTKRLKIAKKQINGYVEIGTPCRYADYIGQYISITGTRYAVHEGSKWGDILESRIPSISRAFFPYDRMIPLNDYAPIDAVHIPDASVDMVVCFIGLHHVPVDKIDNFIQSIKRILRPGGIFLLREHNAHNKKIFKLSWAAHSVFNAIIAQSTEEEEATELRNFQPLTYWIELLKKHGFRVGAERILQKGDPTLNTLIKFTKPIYAEDRFFKNLHQETGHVRLAHQTFLTSPEWFNVDCAQAYGNFLNHTPWYEFPYWQSIKTYWNIFGQS